MDSGQWTVDSSVRGDIIAPLLWQWLLDAGDVDVGAEAAPTQVALAGTAHFAG